MSSIDKMQRYDDMTNNNLNQQWIVKKLTPVNLKLRLAFPQTKYECTK